MRFFVDQLVDHRGGDACAWADRVRGPVTMSDALWFAHEQARLFGGSQVPTAFAVRRADGSLIHVAHADAHGRFTCDDGQPRRLPGGRQ